MSKLLTLGWLIALLLAGVVCTLRFRSRLVIQVWAYETALTTLFLAGFLADWSQKAEGWTYLPVMALCAPRNFLAPTQSPSWIMGWFASSLFGTYVLFVVVCGGMNAVIYAAVTRVIYPDISSQD